MANAAHIVVRNSDQPYKKGGTHDCVIGRDIKINLQALQDYCASLLKEIEHDLVIICGAITYADRIVRRRRATGWCRDLELTVPVNAPDRWSNSKTYHTLVDVLEYVTGDNWSFNFVSGSKQVTIPQTSLELTTGPFVVVPFSDGLDSFLQWRLLAAEEPEVVPLRVQTSHRGMNERRSRSIETARGPRDQRLRVPVSASVGTHPEPSNRTRTFLFFSMVALAAVKINTTRIILGENGIGALGPSLVPYGDECPHRTAHPAFTRRLASFLNSLLEVQVVFEHPQVMRTKGQVLLHARAVGIDGWQQTNSCVRGPRDRLGDKPCGVCSGCLLRRSALTAAGLPQSGFFWEDLSAGCLDMSRADMSARSATENDCDIMRHSAHAMDALARLSDLSSEAPVFKRAAWELIGPNSMEFNCTATDIRTLIHTHAREWYAFRSQFGPSNLLNIEV